LAGENGGTSGREILAAEIDAKSGAAKFGENCWYAEIGSNFYVGK
jgi:hypothetical protein